MTLRRGDTLNDIIEWGTHTWAPALEFWEPYTVGCEGRKMLEIGARHGGLSLHFALKGCHVICSDIQPLSPKAQELHDRYGVANRVTYQQFDACQMPYADNSFDYVCFKSVLGAIARTDKLIYVRQAIKEMHRVLKPGGLLLFAENLVGSPIHQLSRRLFLSWGKKWRYFTVAELRDVLSPFGKLDLHCSGFVEAFGRTEGQRKVLHQIEKLLDPFVPDTSKCIAIGCAAKVAVEDQCPKEQASSPSHTPPPSIPSIVQLRRLSA